MKLLLLVLLLMSSPALPVWAQSKASIVLTVDPVSKHFQCRYTLQLPTDSARRSVLLNLNRQFTVLSGQSPGQTEFTAQPYLYPAFQDTMLGLRFTYADARPRQRRITISYEGTLGGKYATDEVMEFSRHTLWLPFVPYQEDALLDYDLEVRVPAGYSVVSTRAATRQSGGKVRFRGRTAAIEPTVLVSKNFHTLRSKPTGPAIAVIKAGALLLTDTLLLAETARIVAFYNRSLGQQDPITTFSVLLPGTNRSAFGLLDNAANITYSDFDVRKPAERLILAHEISHKWWAYGSISNYHEWLNEGFAVYSSLLYLRATGDTAAFRQQLAVRQQSAIGAPAILGFDRTRYDYPTLRRVIYDKGTAVLAALHQRVGEPRFMEILATSAAQKTATTEAFLTIVAQATDAETRRWLTAELSR